MAVNKDLVLKSGLSVGGLINTAPGSSIYFNNTANNAVYAIYNGAASAATDLRFRAGGVDNITISSSGAIGLRITPYAWQTNTQTIENGESAIWFRQTGSGVDLVSNAYYNGTAWVFKNTGPLTRYSVQAGNFQWSMAPSQAAGTTILTAALAPVMSISNTGVIADGAGNELGFKNIPPVANTWARGKCNVITAGTSIAASAAGDTFSIYNNSTVAVTLTQLAGVTMYLGGTNSTGNRTLLPHGFATLWFADATTAVINGNVT